MPQDGANNHLMFPQGLWGFNLGTINPLTFGRNAKNQRVILFGCQSILDE
jgi:hypothetical protein